MAAEVLYNSSSGSDTFCYEEGSGRFAVVVVPSLLALSTLIVVFQIMWKFLTKRTFTETRLSSAGVYGVDPVLLDTITETLESVNDAPIQWEIPPQCTLEDVKRLQMGNYGPICKGLLHQDNTSTAVVIKTKDGSNQREDKEFVEYVLFHAAVSKHPNIVRMLYCQTRRTPMYMLLEACVPGNLLLFLWSLREIRAENSQAFSERSVYLIANQVAAGLDYLHSNHQFVHGDVAARNMLLGSGLSVKISGLDLGFTTRLLRKVDKELEAKVPVKWQAPERMMRLPLTERSDVWSFGILIYELITLGSVPYPDLEPSQILPQTLAHYRMKRPDHCGSPLHDIMKYCCMWSFKDRPVYSAIIRLLDSYICHADTKPLYSGQKIDVCKYKREAGLSVSVDSQGAYS